MRASFLHWVTVSLFRTCINLSRSKYRESFLQVSEVLNRKIAPSVYSSLGKGKTFFYYLKSSPNISFWWHLKTANLICEYGLNSKITRTYLNEVDLI